MHEITLATNVVVYCKNGWTIILSRGQFGNSATYFERNWQSMEQPFGDPEKEFWIGLENLYNLTNIKDYYALKVEMEGANGVDKIAVYHGFKLVDTVFYTLNMGEYNGTLSTAEDGFALHDGNKFSTYDDDNDQCACSCAAAYDGPGW